MGDTLLVLNAGSSSVKFQLFDDKSLDLLANGEVAHLGARPSFTATNLVTQETNVRALTPQATPELAISTIVRFIEADESVWRLKAVVHRIVHGGEFYVRPVVVTRQVLADLEKLSSLAPLHQPHNLAAIGIVDTLLKAGRSAPMPQVACFDTAFHAGHAPLFTSFALGAEVRDRGVRRYGFHGLSYEWIARALAADHPELSAKRVVVAHLGSGASLCAMKDGKSIDTTMSLTALDGLAMGTRCGALDPGAVIYMLRDLGMEVGEVEQALYNRSGLLGLSGISNDVEVLLKSSDPRAVFALDYFVLKVAQYAAMMAVSLGGLDAIVFTGGIGEHAAAVRDAVMARLTFCGDVGVLVIPANEERLMAVEAQALLDAH